MRVRRRKFQAELDAISDDAFGFSFQAMHFGFEVKTDPFNLGLRGVLGNLDPVAKNKYGPSEWDGEHVPVPRLGE